MYLLAFVSVGRGRRRCSAASDKTTRSPPNGLPKLPTHLRESILMFFYHQLEIITFTNQDDQEVNQIVEWK